VCLAVAAAVYHKYPLFIVGVPAIALGMGGIGYVLFVVQIRAHLRGDKLLIDSARGMILVRGEDPVESVHHIELVTYDLRFRGSGVHTCYGCRRLAACVRDAKPPRLLLRAAANLESIGGQIAEELSVPFVQRHLGTIDVVDDASVSNIGVD